MKAPTSERAAGRTRRIRHTQHLLAGGWLVLIGLLAAPAFAQHPTDTTAGASLRIRRLPEDHSPRGALWRAFALPGWGQIYNRQYYKLPVVYLGLGGITATALYQNHRYLQYRHAYLYADPRLWNDGVPRYPQYADDYRQVLRGSGYADPDTPEVRGQVYNTLKQNRDILRRNRDLLYIGIGLFYGLTIVDAYVNAHLLDFDVGEDLTLSVYPMPGGAAAVLRARR